MDKYRQVDSPAVNSGRITRFDVFKAYRIMAISQVISKFLGSSPSVLDLGCGDGAVLGHIIPRGDFLVVGIDIERNLVEQASKSHPGRHWLVCDGAFLPFRGRSFDTVLMSDVLQGVGNKEKALEILREVRSVTSDRSQVLTSLVNTRTPLRFLRAPFDVLLWALARRYGHSLSHVTPWKPWRGYLELSTGDLRSALGVRSTWTFPQGYWFFLQRDALVLDFVSSRIRPLDPIHLAALLARINDTFASSLLGKALSYHILCRVFVSPDAG